MTTEAIKLLVEDLELNHEYCPKEVILQAAAELRRLDAENKKLKAENDMFLVELDAFKFSSGVAKAETVK